MTEEISNLKLYVWPDSPRLWQTLMPFNNRGSTGETRDQALAVFKADWNDQAPFSIVDGRPPRLKRQDEPREAIPDEQQARLPGYAVYKKLAKRFHSDVHPGATFTADQVMVAVNELWTSMRGGK